MVQSPPSSSQTPAGEASNQITNPTNLPESPPDSGSEPPYSPNVKLNQNSLQMEHMAQAGMNMSTLTELHVPHHHNLLEPSTELYLAAEHQQQLLQINNLLHKHDAPLLPSHHHQSQQQPDHSSMLLYQVNQSGQIIELNHIHHQQNQQQSMGGRLYKNDIVEMENPPLPAIQHIPAGMQSGGNLSDNLQMMGESFPQLGNQTNSVKKRKGSSQSFIPDGDGNLKAFIKSESESEDVLAPNSSQEEFFNFRAVKALRRQKQEEASPRRPPRRKGRGVESG